VATEEMQMTTDPKDPQQRSALAATKAERTRDKEEAMREYEAEKRALLVNTARLRELRLAKEAATALEIKAKPPAKKKVASALPKLAGGKPPAARRKAPRPRSGDALPTAKRSAAEDASSPETEQ
jgi:hypothetical protein